MSECLHLNAEGAPFHQDALRALNKALAYASRSQGIMHTVYLALGSNISNRLSYLRFAAHELQKHGVEVEAKSEIYRTQSVESGGDGEFLNAVVRGRTELNSTQLLAHCQAIEAQAGRDKPDEPGAKREGARALDIDILLFGDEVSNTPELQVPHPRALGRAFVLRPLLDVLEGGEVAPSGLDW